MNLTAVRCEALFVSSLQQSEQPTVQQVREAIVRAVHELGSAGCAARVAQEFGDHPEIAVPRMRWARRVVGDVYADNERDSYRGVFGPGVMPGPNTRVLSTGVLSTGRAAS